MIVSFVQVIRIKTTRGKTIVSHAQNYRLRLEKLALIARWTVCAMLEAKRRRANQKKKWKSPIFAIAIVNTLASAFVPLARNILLQMLMIIHVKPARAGLFPVLTRITACHVFMELVKTKI